MNETELTAGKRIGAMFLDHIFMTVIITIIAFPVFSADFGAAFSEESPVEPTSLDWTAIIMVFGLSLYFSKDAIQGKSLAKRVLKQEVVDVKTGEVASSLKCLLRNITIFLWPIEVIAVMVSPARRIGDYIAGTVVKPITESRDSKPRVEYPKVVLSVLIVFVVLWGGWQLMPGEDGKGLFSGPDYVETSYNRSLSERLEDHVIEKQSEYIHDANILVYDEIVNDSLKYISADFLLKRNYIDGGGATFEGIKQEIFETMFEIVPKEEFILKGKFIYDGRTTKQSTWKNYDWRKID